MLACPTVGRYVVETRQTALNPEGGCNENVYTITKTV